VPARRRNLQRALHVLLPLYIDKINVVTALLLKNLRRIFPKRLQLAFARQKLSDLT